MPDFDFCLIDRTEWTILTAILLGGAIAAGLLLSILSRRNGPYADPSFTGFGIGGPAPIIIGVGLVFGLEKAITPGDKCGFTPDTVGLIFFIPLAPLLISLTLWWRSRMK